MNHRKKLERAGCLLVAAVLALCFPAGACSVPVFRWALERWEPDPYQLAVFHRGPLADEERALLEELSTRASDDLAPANILIEDVDLDAEGNPEWKALWEEQKDQTLPRAVLYYPLLPGRPRHAAWSGPPKSIPKENFLHSPRRDAVADDLLNGETAVWLFLESGDSAKDEAAAKRLSECLATMEKTLRLPDMTGDPVLTGDDPPDVSDLRIDFALERVSRTDPAEALLVDILVGTESDLAEFDEPMAFPVYGRGRILYAFVGAGINEDTVGGACAFLTGRCSCEIKAENPGTDLLMTVDWEGEIDGFEVVKEIELPPLPGATVVTADDVAEAAQETTASVEETSAEPAAASDEMTEDDSPQSNLVRNVVIAVGGAVVLILVGTAVMFGRGGS